MYRAQGYAPGKRAVLEVWSRTSHLSIQQFQMGAEKIRAHGKDVLRGVPVSQAIGVSPSRGRLTVRIGDWESGVYFSRLTSRGHVGYAPFVVRPRRLGEHRVAVVVPTNTWAAYNFRDVDGNGVGDTWYADSSIGVVDLQRPFLNRGVPPHFGGYDLGFLRWFAQTGKKADFFSDSDLERIGSGDELAKVYDLIVFPGHEEYVTPHAYDLIERYRDLGGNLAFLSANSFFYRVERHGHTIHRTGRWRDIGRQEGALTGAQYVGWNHNRYPNKPYVVVGAKRAPWLFRGTGLGNGSRFGKYGIEIDAKSWSSPKGTRVLARIPNAFGPGQSAEMTYYTTARGAKIFAAGAMNFGGTAEWPVVSKLMENLWAHLVQP